MRRLLPVLLLASLLSGCTARSWYQAGRANAEQQCRQLPPGAYEDCMSRVNRQSYEDYEKERQRQ